MVGRRRTPSAGATPQGGAAAVAPEAVRPRCWQRVECRLDPEQVEAVSVACMELGSCGLETQEQGADVRLTAYFAAEAAGAGWRPALVAAVRRAGVASRLRFAVTREEDWEAAWRHGLGPVQATPRIVVHPSWCAVAVAPAGLSICIDPKMAFGTGTHETTRLCLVALETLLRPGSVCLDLGTGSGILAIAAAKLGAGGVLALDTDPLAIANAQENLALNGVGDGRVELCLGGLEAAAGRRFDLVVANIQRSVLAPLLAALGGSLSPGGRLVLSGLLAAEGSAFAADLAGAGLRVVRRLADGEWICLVVAAGPDDA